MTWFVMGGLVLGPVLAYAAYKAERSPLWIKATTITLAFLWAQGAAVFISPLEIKGS